ncbi:MAG: alpha/beta hydrolase family protein [Candidatus Rokuibacteriota bacterium]
MPLRLVVPPIAALAHVFAACVSTAGAQATPLAGVEVTIPVTVTTPSGERTYRMAAVEYRPLGGGPFPAVVLSHGANNDPAERATITAEFPVTAEVLTGLGVVVLSPSRRGYGRTGGAWDEGYGGCETYPRFTEAGLETAKDIAAAAQWLRARQYVDGARLALVGYSAGGWGSLALASRGDVAVRGVVMFAGGRGGPDCAPDRVLDAAGEWGRRAKIPTLWLYSENDSYFPPGFARRMHGAFTGAGGTATLAMLPPFRKEGHYFIDYPEAIPHWRDKVEGFFRQIGLR